MKTVNIHEAKTTLSKLLEAVLAGDSVVIAKAGKPIAKLVPFAHSSSQRTPGLLAGQIQETAESWLPDVELEEAFLGGSVFPSCTEINETLPPIKGGRVAESLPNHDS